ncbi:MAG: nickel-responsive transcriptional regulator NikR [Elusimicrobia bacterium]|jgi:CopG family nickel-responsive transcriptional regulator|nr:nickel-responsive transcriptional regulator NikR [Elusimicrobiota bacterium]
MSKIKRFSVSVKDNLLKDFDSFVSRKGYPTRSKAIEDIVRGELKRESLLKGNMGTGAIILVYDHHKRELVAKLTDIQHDYHNLVICNQHVHLDHNNCMESIVVQGKQKEMQELTDKLKAQKGVKSVSLSIASAKK